MKTLNKVISPAATYPEKVLQFGTGVLLRGLPDYFVEKANRQGLFEGSVLAVKSTSSGRLAAFQTQDNRYTIHIKGQKNGQPFAETLVVSAISRVISAKDGWPEILVAASNPEMQIVVSNTTEAGIILDRTDRIMAVPPRSFPGKLAAFLYERYRVFGGDDSKGLVILPTELIDANGKQLRDIVVRVAQLNTMPAAFINWIQTANTFCNTLVDRIVPGELSEVDRRKAKAVSGYHDDLAIMAEPFRLWAIEVPDERVRNVISFATVDSGVVLTPDITKFKELKLRLLNGTHTFSCALAMLGGWQTVQAAMEDELFLKFVRNLMHQEIIPSLLVIGIDAAEAQAFADSVIDRFANPFLYHQWENISLNYTTKMETRNVVTIERYSSLKPVPDHMALGFAAYLLLLRDYDVNDPFIPIIRHAWKLNDLSLVVDAALGQQSLWKADLREYKLFAVTVKQWLEELMEVGTQEILKTITGKH